MPSDFVFDPDDGAGPAGVLTEIEIEQDGRAVRVLNGTANVTARFRWELNAPAQMMAEGLGGPWYLRLDAESIGSGYEGPLFTDTVRIDPGTNPKWNGTVWEYEYSKGVDASALDELSPPGESSGIYKVVGSVWINGRPNAGTTHDMVAWQEVRLIMHEPLD